jgi:hypothetical protein
MVRAIKRIIAFPVTLTNNTVTTKAEWFVGLNVKIK